MRWPVARRDKQQRGNAASAATPHPALWATFPSRGRLFSCPHPSRGQEGDIRSAGKFPRPVWERMKGAVSRAQLNPITPEPPPSPKFPFAPAVPKPGNLGNFPERRVASFLHTFSRKSMTRSSSARVWGIPPVTLPAADSPLHTGAKRAALHSCAECARIQSAQKRKEVLP